MEYSCRVQWTGGMWGDESGGSPGWEGAGERAGAPIAKGLAMINKSIRVAISALFLAGALGLATTGAAQAQQAPSIMKQCGDEWKAAKANNTTNGMKWPQFLSQCRAQKEATATPASAPAPAPAAAPAPAPAPVAPAPAPTYQPKPKPVPTQSAARATGAGQFTTEAEAKARCPADTVVWVNTKSHIYHYAGTHSYGTTKQGAYMCEADANAAGDRASKSRVDQPKPQT
jgi:hypothetical protein